MWDPDRLQEEGGAEEVMLNDGISKVVRELFPKDQYKAFDFELLRAQLSYLNFFNAKGFFDENFSELQVLSQHIMALKNLKQTGVITPEIYYKVSEKLYDIFDPSSISSFHIPEGHQEFVFQERKDRCIRDVVLAMLYVTKDLSKLGNIKRQKLSELIRKKTKREIALTLRKEDLIPSTQSEPPEDYLPLVPLGNVPFLQHRRWYYGHYEPDLELIIQVKIENRGLAIPKQRSKTSKIYQLTQKGVEKCEHLLLKDPDFTKLVAIARQLDHSFGEMTDTEFERFMKEKVDPKYNKIALGEDFE